MKTLFDDGSTLEARHKTWAFSDEGGKVGDGPQGSAPPVTPPPITLPPTSAATGLSLNSVAGTGFLLPGAASLSDSWNSQTVSASGYGTQLSAASQSSSTGAAPATGTLTANQTVSGSWTGPLAGTATFNDSWSANGVSVPAPTATAPNANLNFGLGAPQSYASAVFNFTLGTAGSYDVNWSAVTSGAGNFGLLNMAISVDGGALIYSPTQLAAVVSPTGDYVGALAAGAHTVAIYDVSNVTGFPSGSGTLNESLNLTVTPSSSTTVAVNNLALSSMTSTQFLQSSGQTLTSSATGLDLFQGTAAQVKGDVFANLQTNDIIRITDMSFAGLGFTVSAASGNTVVTLAENSASGGVTNVNGQTTSFTIAGTYSQSSFHIASDGANGILIAHS